MRSSNITALFAKISLVAKYNFSCKVALFAVVLCNSEVVPGVKAFNFFFLTPRPRSNHVPFMRSNESAGLQQTAKFLCVYVKVGNGARQSMRSNSCSGSAISGRSPQRGGSPLSQGLREP